MAPGARRQRLHLTLLFLDLCGSSRLAEQVDAEHLADILAVLQDICRTVVKRHGGHVARLQGDGALAVFGYPTPSEDDGRRAAEAALEIHALISQIESEAIPFELSPLQMHSGIHSGLVLVSPGDIELGRLELVGDAANTAARLSALAPAGVIVADVEALGPQSHFFQLGPAQVRQLHGRTAPVRTVEILGQSGLQRRFDATAQRGLTDFVGREAVLVAMAGLLSSMQASSRPMLVQVRGEAGIGKTRLLEELTQLDQARRFACVRGYCENYLGAEVLQPFAQILRGLSEQANAGPDDPQARPQALPAQLLQALGRLAEHRPLLLVLDDWQWADDASRRLLEAVLKLNLPILVIQGVRSAVEQIEHIEGAVVMNLTGFSEAETRATVARWLPGADPFIAREIHHYAGGVPLLVEELCHAFQVHGQSGTWAQFATQGARAGRLVWLSSIVGARLARLTERQQSLVRVAAVLGNAFPLALFAQLVSLDSSADELPALAEADFVFPAERGMLRFKHGLTRDAVFETVGLQERTAIHHQVLAILSAQANHATGVETFEALAYHARAAGSWQDAAHWGELAGDKAMQSFAFDRARALYLAVVEALDRKPSLEREPLVRRCAVVHKLGMTLIFDPLALPEALPMFERNLEQARQTGDQGLQARSEYWMGYLSYGFGHPRRAITHCRQALALATAQDDLRLVAQVAATLGQALAAACQYEEALARIQAALGVKRQGVRSGSSVAVGSSFTLATRASVLADQGDFAGAHRDLDEAWALLGDSMHPVANSVRNWAMVVLAWQGRWDDAQQVADDAMRMAERSQALLPLAISRAVSGYAQWKKTGSPVHLATIAEAVNWMEQRRCTFFTSIYYGWLVEGYAELQQLPEARRHAARLLMRVRVGEALGEAFGFRALALATTDARRSARYLARADNSARNRGSRREAALNLACRAQLLHRQGQAQQAAALATQARDELADMDMPWYAELMKRWMA